MTKTAQVQCIFNDKIEIS